MSFQNQSYHLNKLRKEYCVMRKKNPSFSLRSFAKYLNVHPGNLSSVMKERRPFPLKWADSVALRLQLSPIESAEFIQSVSLKRKSLKDLCKFTPNFSQEILDDQTAFEIISEWEHYAIFELIKLVSNKKSPPNKMTAEVIASRMEIDLDRVELALNRLIEVKAIEECALMGHVNIVDSLEINRTIPSAALRASHKDTLQLGIEKLDSTKIAERHYCSETIAVNTKNIPAAKELIDEFRKKLACFLEEGEQSEVFHFCLFLHPVTKTKGESQ